jgi:hypothetical protein
VVYCLVSVIAFVVALFFVLTWIEWGLTAG